MAHTEGHHGLPKFESALKKILPCLRVHPRLILGKRDEAGAERPLPTSAARLSVDDQSVWVPWPEWRADRPSRGVGAILIRSGRQCVFPTIRLQVKCLRSKDPNGKQTWHAKWEYLTLDDWLVAALTEWIFPLGTTDDQTINATLRKLRSEKPITQEEQEAVVAHLGQSGWPTVEKRLLAKSACAQPDQFASRALHVVGKLIRYALAGKPSWEKSRLDIHKDTGLALPCRDLWVRETAVSVDLIDDALATNADPEESVPGDVDGEPASDLRLHSVRSQVISARVDLVVPEYLASGQAALRRMQTGDGVPRIGKAAELWLDPTQERQARGIDPFHTPEAEDIRTRLHLGQKVRVDRRRLVVPAENPLSLSRSTDRLPFAGFNDPRRVLMAAKAQEQAVQLCKGDTPAVVTSSGRTGIDPPGVNLRVGYLAWAGWNHEDAWVISASAGERLVCEDRYVQTILLRPCELDCASVFKVGDRPHEGELLVKRKIAPAFLWPDLKRLAPLIGHPERWQGGDLLWEDVEDRAKHGAEIVRIEVWDLMRGTLQVRDHANPDSPETDIAEQFEIGDETRRRYRKVIRLHFRRVLPLQVGDKLANRHGHKGVVGLILPDERMPRWQGQPLEALIDPISVINRSNWGQLYECLAGAVAQREGRTVEVGFDEGASWLAKFRAAFPQADSCGRSEIESLSGGWLSGSPQSVRAVAGTQFVMRMPQHAETKLSADPDSRGGQRGPRGAKFSLWEHFALWAHGLPRRFTSPPNLTKGAHALKLVLSLAGVDVTLVSSDAGGPTACPPSPHVKIRRSDLANDPPPENKFRPRRGGKGFPSMASQLQDLEGGKLYFLAFAKPLDVAHPGRKTPWRTIRWFPVISARDIPGFSAEWKPRLLTALEKLCRLAVPKSKATNKELLTAIRNVVQAALELAVGTNWENSKKSVVQSRVQAVRVSSSGRAVITPSGLPSEGSDRGEPGKALSDLVRDRGRENLPLGIDEIELPEVLADAIRNGRDERREAASAGGGPSILLKRDPVLHRWGLLPVRYRVVPGGNTIRLPASLLGPLGADYDGDDAAVFAIPKALLDSSREVTPSQISMHDFWKEPQFVPSKQYVYGLHLLRHNPTLTSQFQEDLNAIGAPRWPDDQGVKAKELLAQWLRGVGDCESREGRWWAVLEKYALLALAADPGMGLGIFRSPEELLKLDVVQCGAAKGELYESSQDSRQSRMMRAILDGLSLTLHLSTDSPSEAVDPIGEIMAAAAPLKPKFGSAVRKLVFGIRHAGDRVVLAAQTLTEKLSQSVLSVKAVGTKLPSAKQYDRLLQERWLKKSDAFSNTAEARTLDENLECPLVDKIVKEAERCGVTEKLDDAFRVGEGEGVPDWRAWLHEPAKLLELLHSDSLMPGKELLLPLDDVRVQPFVTVMGVPETPRPQREPPPLDLQSLE